MKRNTKELNKWENVQLNFFEFMFSNFLNIQTYVHRRDLTLHVFINLILFIEHCNIAFPLYDYKFNENIILNCYLIFHHDLP